MNFYSKYRCIDPLDERKLSTKSLLRSEIITKRISSKKIGIGELFEKLSRS